VCAGYAAGYNYVLRLLGVESRYMTGNVKKNLLDKLFPLTMKDGGHAWNLVKLDGDWYWVDVTWDDTGLDPDEDGIQVIHEYCFVDDDKIFESRKLLDGTEGLPKCKSMKLNEKLLEADAEAAANAG
jgi:transglutaminase/protease-like cytokinesis protein 3